MDSIILEISPPDATFLSGWNSSPLFVITKNSMSSIPFEFTETVSPFIFSVKNSSSESLLCNIFTLKSALSSPTSLNCFFTFFCITDAAVLRCSDSLKADKNNFFFSSFMFFSIFSISKSKFSTCDNSFVSSSAFDSSSFTDNLYFFFKN